MKQKTTHKATNPNRRHFIKNSAMVVGMALTAPVKPILPDDPTPQTTDSGCLDGELLYNGIHLPEEWPPRTMRPDSYDPMSLPYLASPPAVIPIDIGRQLFVDDFLIEYTNTTRKFHQPVKYGGNPILQPGTEVEQNKGFCPVAGPFSDGCFYDPIDKVFKLWYMAGWFDGTALAISTDGIHWERPLLDVVKGTNLVLPLTDSRRDGASIWLDHEAINPAERFKMYIYERKGTVGDKLDSYEGFLLTSHNGINWQRRAAVKSANDNNTFFYNPFRKKWVFTIRRESRPSPPWSNSLRRECGRARSYWEHEDFMAAGDGWKDTVFWFGADRYDNKRAHYAIGEDPQIYKVDAAGYESILIGLIQMHYGPTNEQCAKGGFPKLTELQMAFSRDGFHWDRSCRETFIGAEVNDKNSWERAYIHSAGGVCNIVGDQLHFYYTAFRGDENKRTGWPYWDGMYANASMGLATLRRDGFASMETLEEGILLTKILRFSGNYLFLNVDSSRGKLYVELCNESGKAIEGYTKADCAPVVADSTKQQVNWTNHANLELLAGKPIRLKFYFSNAKLYSFWVSHTKEGNSGGALAAGGPGLKGTWDL